MIGIFLSTAIAISLVTTREQVDTYKQACLDGTNIMSARPIVSEKTYFTNGGYKEQTKSTYAHNVISYIYCDVQCAKIFSDYICGADKNTRDIYCYIFDDCRYSDKVKDYKGTKQYIKDVRKMFDKNKL